MIPMKLSLTLTGGALLLIAATGLVMEIRRPASTPEASIPAPQLPTRKVRPDKTSAFSPSDSAGKEEIVAETVSASRRNSPASEKKALPEKELESQVIETIHPDTSVSQRPASMPLAYQLDANTLADQFPNVPASALEQIKDAFEKDLGPDQLDPASSEYARRWQSAEVMAAARLRAYYGWRAYAGMQKAAVIEN